MLGASARTPRCDYKNTQSMELQFSPTLGEEPKVELCRCGLGERLRPLVWSSLAQRRPRSDPTASKHSTEDSSRRQHPRPGVLSEVTTDRRSASPLRWEGSRKS